MQAKNILIEEIRHKLFDYTGIALTYPNIKNNSIVQIKEECFRIEVKSEITQGNKGIVFQQLKNTK